MNANTVVTDTISEEVKLRLAKKVVFKSYITRLTRSIDSELTRINDLNPVYFHIWTTKRLPVIENKVNTTWDALFHNNELPKNFPMPIYIGTLKNAKVLTVNNDTKLESEKSKDELYNIPASSWLFSTAYTGKSYITDDWQYDKFEYNPTAYISSKQTVCDYLTSTECLHEYNSLKNDPFDINYWHDSYDFASAFDDNEYKVYDINKTILPEDRAVFGTSDGNYDMVKYSSKIEAIIITYGNYRNINLLPYNKETYKNFQPVVYCELHNPVAYMKGTITIQWSQDGIISIN